MNEKMMILKMLEEGKITAAEASKLLESAGGGTSKANPAQKPPEPRQQEPRYHEPRHSEPARPPERDNRQIPPPSSSASSSFGGLEEFTVDLSKKFESFARDIEPKIQKITEVVAEKTASFADRIAKGLPAATPPPSASPYQSGSRETASAPRKSSNVEEKVFESFVTPGFNELNFSGLNGDVLVKGYNGDKISARIYYKAKRMGARIEIMKLGNKYFLNYEEDEFEKVSIDAFVPEAMFNNINIQTINGQLSISTLKTDNCMLSNANAATEIKDVHATNLKIDCSNGLLKLENIYGSNAKIENFNSNISVMAIDIANVELVAQNGSVSMNIASFDRYSDYTWVVDANNGKLTLNLPSGRDLGYHLKAHTTLSNIKVGLTGLSYIFNEPSFVEAKSTGYDIGSKKVRLSLETSNAPIVVN